MTHKSSRTPDFVLQNCIIRYPHIFKPQQIQGKGEFKYSAKLYITQQSAGIVYERAKELASSGFKQGEYELQSFGWPVTQANSKPADRANPLLSDKFVINAKASVDYPPVVVDRHVEPMMNQNEIYSGCIVNVAVNLFTYNHMGNVGVGVGLKGVMKLSDGEPIADDALNPQTLFADVLTQTPHATVDVGTVTIPSNASNQTGQGEFKVPDIPGLGSPPFKV